MAWTTPMTATANEIWTASEFNTHVRDNLNETEVAKVTAANQYLVSTGANALAARTASAATVATSQTTTSTSLTDLATVGPAVTATTGTKALVHVSGAMANNTADQGAVIGLAVSGASTIAATALYGTYVDGVPANQTNRQGVWSLLTGLTSGSNTFTLKYRVYGGTGTFSDRHIIVVPL